MRNSICGYGAGYKYPVSAFSRELDTSAIPPEILHGIYHGEKSVLSSATIFRNLETSRSWSCPMRVFFNNPFHNFYRVRLFQSLPDMGPLKAVYRYQLFFGPLEIANHASLLPSGNNLIILNYVLAPARYY